MQGNIIYIDNNGAYGEAEGMIVLRRDDLTPDGEKSLNEALESGTNLKSWALNYLIKNRIPRSSTVIKKSGAIVSQELVDENNARLDKAGWVSAGIIKEDLTE
jgi:hypothetical protein